MDQGSFGSVMERLWVTSGGVALKFNENDPLWAEVTDRNLCFKGQYQKSVYMWNDEPSKTNTLTYSICQTENVVQAQKFAISIGCHLFIGVIDAEFGNDPSK